MLGLEYKYSSSYKVWRRRSRGKKIKAKVCDLFAKMKFYSDNEDSSGDEEVDASYMIAHIIKKKN